LKERQYQEQKPKPISNTLEERLTELELENANLREQSSVLYKQNSDYRRLVQGYRACLGKVNRGIERIMGAREAMDQITQAVKDDVKVYQEAVSNVLGIEKEAIRDWIRFVDVNARIGVKVKEVVNDIVEEHAVDITVYPYKSDPNMI
jgi:hypothetical protein